MGSVNIDNTGSGADVTLSSDGTSLLLDGTAVGGGALELYAENPSSPTAPSATGTNAVAIGTTTTASGDDSITAGSFSSATAYAASAFGVTAVAAGSYSVAIGRGRAGGATSLSAVIDNNTSSYGATAANAIAMGYQAKASQSYAFATGYQAIASDNSAIAMGFSADATGSSSVAIGYMTTASALNSLAMGRLSTASGNYSCAIGNGATASASYAFAFCDSATASGLRSVALGRSSTQGISGKHSRGAYTFSSVGDAQEGKYVLLSDTTDATAEALTTTNGAASATNQIILPDNSAYAFHGTIVARQQAAGGTASAAWKIEGLIRREGTAATTTLVNSATTVLDNTPSWGMALSADTTNGGLKVEVTGAAATNIRWVSTIHTSEVTYA